ncbi:MAG: peptidoglycan DD-metalloendopeptidase family protein [Bacteroidaceae bacterium]|nr:peptidoglycan DD-metalloendopeptidase family protein [Bacteroidaceae bacterium]
MHIRLKNIASFLLTAAAFAVTQPGTAQDKLASVAPVDTKMRAIDSIAIKRLVQHEEEIMFEFPAEDLYPEWNNTYTTNFEVQIPSEYKIDLRNFCMPTPSRLVNSHYGYRRSFRRQHYGTDIKVYLGDTIYAAFTGKVRIVAYNGRGYGKYVLIRHPNGLETLYGHLSKQLVHEDDIVKAGQPIGLGGNTGRSYGSHLHFETRFLGQFIDPEKLFNFEAQDVLGDFYVYRSNGKGQLLAEHEVTDVADPQGTGEGKASLAAASAAEKTQESQAFQEKRRAEMQAKPRSSVHKVRSGESLSTIAKKYHTTVSKLCRLNGITEKTILRPGQILKYS